MAIHDLHSHLYGCLQPQDVQWLVQRVTNWDRFARYQNKYREIFGTDVKLPTKEGLTDKKKLSSLYQYRQRLTDHSDFQIFQIHFDLLISLITLSVDEIVHLVQRVVSHETAQYVEYRFMFPLNANEEFVTEKLDALDEAFKMAEKKYKKQIKGIFSLPRHANTALFYYQILKKRQARAGLTNLVGIDFCGQEEGYPPQILRPIFQKVKEDNQKNPQDALAVLYHVGEFYNDKSIESAVRWIIESHELGCHRLGHAIALGISPEIYLGQTREERAIERVAHLDFLLAKQDVLQEFGYRLPNHVQQEKDQLLAKIRKNKKATVVHHYDEQRIKDLRCFQNWALEFLAQRGAIIECCLTSNRLLTDSKSYELHPIKRFLQNNLSCILATDDRGIFSTTMLKEIQIARHKVGLTEKEVEKLCENARTVQAKKLMKV